MGEIDRQLKEKEMALKRMEQAQANERAQVEARRMKEKEVAERNAAAAASNKLKQAKREAEAKREMELMEAKR